MINIKSIIKFIPYIIIILLIIIIIFLQRCSVRKQNAYINNITSYKDTAKTYKDKTGNLISYNETLEAQNRQQLSDLLKANKQLYLLQQSFKTVESATEIKTVIKLLHDTIHFKDSIPCNFDIFSIVDTNKWYHLKVLIGPDLFSIDTLSIFNTQSCVIGEKKVSFWKKPKRRIEVINTNPYFITTNIGSYVISEDKKWYQTTAFKFGVGLVTGYFISTKIK